MVLLSNDTYIRSVLSTTADLSVLHMTPATMDKLTSLSVQQNAHTAIPLAFTVHAYCKCLLSVTFTNEWVKSIDGLRVTEHVN